MSYRTNNRELATSFIQNAAVALDGKGMRKFQEYSVPFSERRFLLIAVDTLLMLFSVWCAFLIWGYADTGQLALINNNMQQGWFWFPVLLVGWIALAWLNDLYDIPSSYDKALNTMRVGTVALLGLCLYLGIFFIVPDMLPRIFFLNFLVLFAALTTAWRWIYVELSAIMPFYHRVLIVGGGERARTIVQALEEAAGLKYQVVGYADDGMTAAPIPNLPMVGQVKDVNELAKQLGVHEIVVAIEDQLDRDLFHLLVECQSNGVLVSWMPDLYEKLCRKIPIQHVDPSWALQAMQARPVFSRLQQALKRMLDIVLVLCVLPTVVLIMPMVALAIKLDSRGPVFYRQTRCGRAGKPFSIFKFRTMTTDAEKDGKARWASANDNRITKVGRVLRKTRLDELPQIFNILRGEMSIVGPRPERPEFIEELQQEIPYYRTRLMVKPGLTGWAQVHYDYGNSVEDALIKLQYDFYYVRYWSIWLDIYTMFQTFAVVFKFKGT